jgi:DNA topoisomerase-1
VAAVSGRSRRTLGDHPQKGGPIVVKNGRYGPYVVQQRRQRHIAGDKTPEAIYARRGDRLA